MMSDTVFDGTRQSIKSGAANSSSGSRRGQNQLFRDDFGGPSITLGLPTACLALGCFKTFDLAALAPDRIFGYADVKLVDEVRFAAQQGEFATEPASDLGLHGDATSSFKEIQFGEANVQLTFHEKTIPNFDPLYTIE